MNPPIDSNATVMFPGPESSKDIGKIVHDRSGFTSISRSYQNNFVCKEN